MEGKVKDWYRLPEKQVLQELNSSPQGLSKAEVDKRLQEFGRNVIPSPKGKSLLRIFFGQFLSPLIYILIGAGILSLVAGDTEDAVFIFIIIFINAILGTWQEWKAENSAAALKSLVKVKTRVKRDNHIIELDAEELVPGDIVILESGMKVPADMRLFEVNDLSVEEALLTGESVPVSKSTAPLEVDRPAIGDQVNMAFAGTTVVRGRSMGVITGTAIDTEIGKIAESLSTSEPEKPPLINRMDAFSKKITVAVLIICVILGIIGWLRNMPIMEIVFFMIAVGVSAIPEGLPVALTVALSIGTRRMAKRNVIVRKLPAVEGLGSCTIIASDKTGTLTLDEQSVKVVVLPDGQRFEVEGQGYNGDGEVKSTQGNNGSVDELLSQLIRIGIISNEATLEKQGEEWKHSGDAVDVALLALAYKSGKDPKTFHDGVEIVKVIPYESERKYAGVFFRNDGQLKFAMKGALEVVKNNLSQDDTKKAHDISEELASQGYRVLSFAQAPVETEDLEKLPPLQLAGLIGLIDPLRPEAVDAINECKGAGIQVLMITGDHPATALTIARQLSIAEDASQVISGRELAEIENDEKRFAEAVSQKKVYARVAPLQKKKIVEGLKNQQQFIAVTGDGANDAPALRIAHIGIAMGGGTDLAKEASSLIVTDNNFASIAAGVEEGRFTYDNLRKIIYLLISTGAAEILMVAIPLILGMPLPFIAVQLLWLNLVTNGIQDISLAFEKGDIAVMKKPPRDPSESIFDRIMNEQIVVSALVMSALTVGTWYWLVEVQEYEIKHARTLIMMLMVLLQNFHVLNCRSEMRSIFTLSFRSNYVVLLGLITAQLVHISAAYIPGLNDILQLQPVLLREWALLLPAASIILIAMEIFKFFVRRRERNNENRK